MITSNSMSLNTVLHEQKFVSCFFVVVVVFSLFFLHTKCNMPTVKRKTILLCE